MTHKKKAALARKMRTRQEQLDGVSIWDSRAWRERKTARRVRELNKGRVIQVRRSQRIVDAINT